MEPDLSSGGLVGKKTGMLMVDPDQASDPDGGEVVNCVARSLSVHTGLGSASLLPPALQKENNVNCVIV